MTHRPIQILVFAGVPPPVHGQNVMVASMLSGLTEHARFRLFHVNPQLSRTQQEIGRWRFGKLCRLISACLNAIRLRLTHGPMLFYYVPAPAKRAAIVRDWIVMAFCRPFFQERVLHWHAVGLGDWIQSHASGIERILTTHLLGNASAALVLAPELAADARVFRPRRLLVVANGIADPLKGIGSPQRRARSGSFRVLFLGAGSTAKGLFRTISAVNAANTQRPGAFELTFAGGFETPDDENRFRAAAAYSNGAIKYAGFADEDGKRSLLQSSDVLCFPTQYAHEGQPLVLIEAMAFGLPIIATRWRAIQGMLPRNGAWLVDPDEPKQLLAALLAAAEENAAPVSALREHYVKKFCLQTHLARLTSALEEIDSAKTGSDRGIDV